jgi:hypothetical protein
MPVGLGPCAIAAMKCECPRPHRPKGGISTAIKFFAGSGTQSRWGKPGDRRFNGELCLLPDRRDHNQKPLVDRLPGFCPSVHPLDVSQWTAALGPGAKATRRQSCNSSRNPSCLIFIVSYRIVQNKRKLRATGRPLFYQLPSPTHCCGPILRAFKAVCDLSAAHRSRPDGPTSGGSTTLTPNMESKRLWNCRLIRWWLSARCGMAA